MSERRLIPTFRNTSTSLVHVTLLEVSRIVFFRPGTCPSISWSGNKFPPKLFSQFWLCFPSHICSLTTNNKTFSGTFFDLRILNDKRRLNDAIAHLQSANLDNATFYVSFAISEIWISVTNFDVFGVRRSLIFLYLVVMMLMATSIRTLAFRDSSWNDKRINDKQFFLLFWSHVFV